MLANDSLVTVQKSQSV